MWLSVLQQLVVFITCDSFCIVRGSEFENSISEKHLPVVGSEHRNK